MKKLIVLFAILLSVLSANAQVKNYRSVVPVLCEGKIMFSLCEVQISEDKASIYIDEKLVKEQTGTFNTEIRYTAAQTKNNEFELATFSSEEIAMSFTLLTGEKVAEVLYTCLYTRPVSTKIEDKYLEKVMKTKDIFF